MKFDESLVFPAGGPAFPGTPRPPGTAASSSRGTAGPVAGRAGMSRGEPGAVRAAGPLLFRPFPRPAFQGVLR